MSGLKTTPPSVWPGHAHSPGVRPHGAEAAGGAAACINIAALRSPRGPVLPTGEMRWLFWLTLNQNVLWSTGSATANPRGVSTVNMKPLPERTPHWTQVWYLFVFFGERPAIPRLLVDGLGYTNNLVWGEKSGHFGDQNYWWECTERCLQKDFYMHFKTTISYKTEKKFCTTYYILFS